MRSGTCAGRLRGCASWASRRRGVGVARPLGAGEAVRIMTGAPVPEGADSVQQVEVTRESEGGRFVEVERATEPGQFYVLRGSEIRAGETVLRAGEEVNGGGRGVLAAFGYASVSVRKRPRVAVLATGSELVPAGGGRPRPDTRLEHLLAGGLRAARGRGGEALPFAGDDPRCCKGSSRRPRPVGRVGASGGVSMGLYDFTKAALHALGAEIFSSESR